MAVEYFFLLRVIDDQAREARFKGRCRIEVVIDAAAHRLRGGAGGKNENPTEEQEKGFHCVYSKNNMTCWKIIFGGFIFHG